MTDSMQKRKKKLNVFLLGRELLNVHNACLENSKIDQTFSISSQFLIFIFLGIAHHNINTMVCH